MRTTRGMIVSERQATPLLAFTVMLYRSNPLFRGLVDLAVVGGVTLGVVTSDLLPANSTAGPHQPVTSQRPSLPVAQQPHGKSGVKWTSLVDGAGFRTLEHVERETIPASVIGLLPQPVGDKLKQIRFLIARRQAQRAADIAATLDPADPATLYAQAVIALNRPERDSALDAMRRLRGATAKGFAPAFVLNGAILLRLVAMHERGNLDASQLNSIDGAGNVVRAKPEELLAEAVQWWERGAAFQYAPAMRYLGLAEARGYSGRKSIAGAVAHWKEAARLGDAVARTELGEMHLWGIGVDQDVHKAAGLFRDAAHQQFPPAYLSLGIALLPAALKGDLPAAAEAEPALLEAIRRAWSRRDAADAYYTLGLFVHDVVSPRKRSPERATAYWMAAAALGHRSGALAAVRAMRTGVGTAQNKPVAYSILRDLAKAAPELAE